MKLSVILFIVVKIPVALIIFLVSVNLHCFGYSLVQKSEVVRIQVTENKHPERIVYEYTVINHSSDQSVSIDVGIDFPKDSPELTVLPFEAESHSDKKISGIFSPHGWNGIVIFQEESSKHWISWKTISKRYKGLSSGRSYTGFRVSLPKPDETYTKCHYMIITKTGRQYRGYVELIPSK
jgi:hypothetical protein